MTVVQNIFFYMFFLTSLRKQGAFDRGAIGTGDNWPRTVFYDSRLGQKVNYKATNMSGGLCPRGGGGGIVRGFCPGGEA